MKDHDEVRLGQSPNVPKKYWMLSSDQHFTSSGGTLRPGCGMTLRQPSFHTVPSEVSTICCAGHVQINPMMCQGWSLGYIEVYNTVYYATRHEIGFKNLDKFTGMLNSTNSYMRTFGLCTPVHHLCNEITHKLLQFLLQFHSPPPCVLSSST